MTNRKPNKERTEKLRYEYCYDMFKRIKALCVVATENRERTTVKYFIDNGIPADFMKMCVSSKLCAGGKNGQNLFWNWSQNKIHPSITVDNFLKSLRLRTL